MSEGELILYTTEDGLTEIQLRAMDQTVWLTQLEIAALFDTSKQNVSLHINNILSDGELDADAVVKDSLTTAADGKSYQTKLYNLDVILSVGYRVRSPRGVQFRRWATTVLREYLVKGFAMNDARLKDPAADYFEELIARIRDIRASEARVYQKVRDILALSEDYASNAQAVQDFYAKIQNKMLYAVTGHTAGELIIERADPAAPDMGLTSKKGKRVRKADVTIAKNYLGEPEISELNQIVTMFLDTADFRARRRQTMRLAEWEPILDNFLAGNELPILRNAGTVSARQAEQIAHQRYATFDLARKEADRAAAEQVDELEELKRIARISETAKGKKQ